MIWFTEDSFMVKKRRNHIRKEEKKYLNSANATGQLEDNEKESIGNRIYRYSKSETNHQLIGRSIWRSVWPFGNSTFKFKHVEDTNVLPFRGGRGGVFCLDTPVDRLYCKRPILCLSSSKILTPSPLTARRVCTASPPPPLVRVEDTLAKWKGVGGSIFWKTPDTALYSTYVSTLWTHLSRLRL